jgi:hypothetical protein
LRLCAFAGEKVFPAVEAKPQRKSADQPSRARLRFLVDVEAAKKCVREDG